MKIRPVGPEFFRSDGQTNETDRQRDRHDEALTVTFHNLAKSPNKDLVPTSHKTQSLSTKRAPVV